MSVQRIPQISITSCSAPIIDEEHLRIIRKLREYGLSPTGNKSSDKAKLREVELKKAQQENSVSNKFETVSKSEQEEIQKKKKAKKKELNPELEREVHPEKFEGSRVLGQQLYLAIEMKKNKNNSKFVI